jgi:hypothetical protein
VLGGGGFGSRFGRGLTSSDEVWEKRGVEGREDSSSSSRAERFRERNFCLGVELAVKILLESGSGVVHKVDRD